MSLPECVAKMTLRDIAIAIGPARGYLRGLLSRLRCPEEGLRAEVPPVVPISRTCQHVAARLREFRVLCHKRLIAALSRRSDEQRPILGEGQCVFWGR